LSKLVVLDQPVIERVLDEAFALLRGHGVRVDDAEARDLLASAGAHLDADIVRVAEPMVRRALATTPRTFTLHARDGQPAVQYGGEAVHFDPGSSALHVLDGDTQRIRPARTHDLERIVRVTEVLPSYAAQSTAVVCEDVPPDRADFHRLHVVLRGSAKPIITGAFTLSNTKVMLDLLRVDLGGPARLVEQPRAVFDVCPSPPMHWTEFAAGSLLLLGRAGVPVEIISMPLAGGTGPVTLLGVLAQHAAETLAGITLHQLAAPGAPAVWGGAATLMDMSTGLAPIGAMETALLAAGYSQVGKALGLPTHAYLGATDAKLVDAQAGLEGGMTALVGALAGINMISGAGLLDSLAAFSLEKLVLDAEVIGMIRRLEAGFVQYGDTLATQAFAEAALIPWFRPSLPGFGGDAARAPARAPPAIRRDRTAAARGVGGGGANRCIPAGARPRSRIGGEIHAPNGGRGGGAGVGTDYDKLG
jgi:trimethylamine---corrinoid protein Co-methyltransferase